MFKKNKNTESRYASHLGIGLGSKKFESASAYKSAMFKVLGDYSEEKENKGDKIGKIFSKNFNKENNEMKLSKENNDIKEEDKK